MNRENLKKMAEYIATVPQKKFGMGSFRNGSASKHKCGSVGCVIGHCTAVDKVENIPMGDVYKNGKWVNEINFWKWSERFTGLKDDSDEWDWCFAPMWEDVDNTPTGASYRINWLLENGLPKNWRDQMAGREPLCYQPNKIQTQI